MWFLNVISRTESNIKTFLPCHGRQKFGPHDLCSLGHNLGYVTLYCKRDFAYVVKVAGSTDLKIGRLCYVGPLITWVLQSRGFFWLETERCRRTESPSFKAWAWVTLAVLRWRGQYDKKCCWLRAEIPADSQKEMKTSALNTRTWALFISRNPCLYFKGLQIRG